MSPKEHETLSLGPARGHSLRTMARVLRRARAKQCELQAGSQHHPRHRGANENTNGLLRQYLPKGIDFSGYTQRELNVIVHGLNTRQRKCLHVATSLEVYARLRHHSLVALGV